MQKKFCNTSQDENTISIHTLNIELKFKCEIMYINK